MQELEIYIEVKGYSIRKSTVDILIARILARLRELSNQRTYTLKQICGVEFWDDFIPKEERTVAGIYVFHEVELGNLPLRHVEGKHEYPIRYCPDSDSTLSKED